MWKWLVAGAGVVVLGAGAFFVLHGLDDHDGHDDHGDMEVIEHGDLEIIDAYVIANSGTADTAAAFFMIENDGDQSDRLIMAKSDVARAVELHTHIDDNGVMKMRPLENGIEIAAGEEHALERGGDHVMFMGLKEPLGDGDTFELTLEFQNAGPVTFMVKVGEEGHEGHDH